jgi:hypothetical protein
MDWNRFASIHFSNIVMMWGACVWGTWIRLFETGDGCTWCMYINMRIDNIIQYTTIWYCIILYYAILCYYIVIYYVISYYIISYYILYMYFYNMYICMYIICESNCFSLKMYIYICVYIYTLLILHHIKWRDSVNMWGTWGLMLFLVFQKISIMLLYKLVLRGMIILVTSRNPLYNWQDTYLPTGYQPAWDGIGRDIFSWLMYIVYIN